MPNLNELEIVGYVGKKPELRFTPNGKPVADFSVAVDTFYFKDNNGERQKETDWFNVIVWNKLAESCNQYIAKGMLVYVSGRVSLHTWERKDGGQGSRLDLNARTVLFLERKNNDSVESESEDSPF